MSRSSLSVSVSGVTPVGFTVNGGIQLGSSTYNGYGFNCYTAVDGIGTNNHNVVIPEKGGRRSISNYYGVGHSWSDRTFTCKVGGDFNWSNQYGRPSVNPVTTTVNVPAGLHSVSYNANGGTGAPSAQTKSWGTILTLSSTKPTRTGYTFLRWNTSSNGEGTNYSPGQQYGADTNVTLYAQWSANEYTYNITYKSSSGKSLGSSSSKNKFGGTYTISAPAKTGYNTPSSQNVTWDSVDAKNIIFVYTPISYSISYNLGGGSVSGNPTSYNIESSSITLKNPTRAGYNFTGWAGSNLSSASMSVTIPGGSTGNKSYTANWSNKTYTVSFNANLNEAVSNMPSSFTKTHFVSVKLPSNVPTARRYEFIGWSTSSGGEAKYQPGDTYSTEGNATLYAIWKLKASVVKVYQPDGTGRDGICSIYDDAGNHHYAIFWVYDNNGNRHEVL